VHADPASEMPAVLCLLDGVMELASTTGTREVAADDFFVGPMESALRPGELAVAARFTCPPARSGSAFVEVARRHGDYAVCGVGAVVTVDADNALVTGRVAVINVGLRPVRIDVTEAITGAITGAVTGASTGAITGATGSGDGLDEDALRALVDAAIDPEADIHASAEYRRHLAHVLTRRALDQASMRAVSPAVSQ